MSKPRQVIELDEAIARAAAWVQDRVEEHGYGTFGFSVTCHDSRVSKVQESATYTVKPSRDTGGRDEHNDTR